MTTSLSSAVAAGLRSWFYVFEHGFLYASPRLESGSTKFHAALLLSVTGAPFELGCGGKTRRVQAALVQPEVERRVSALGVPLVSLGLTPQHPLFRRFSTVEYPDALRELPLDQFDPFMGQMEAATDGQLSAHGAAQLAFDLMQSAAQTLPDAPPLDPRIACVLASIERDALAPLEELAAEVSLSYHRLSHLFSASMGVSLRTYLLARKLDIAASLAGRRRSLTEVAFMAGFADSAHFSKSWLRASGASPSAFFGNRDVSVISSYGNK